MGMIDVKCLFHWNMKVMLQVRNRLTQATSGDHLRVPLPQDISGDMEATASAKHALHAGARIPGVQAAREVADKGRGRGRVNLNFI